MENKILEIQNKQYVKGIKALATVLGVSTFTAQALKNSGRIPYAQFNRTIYFDMDKVMEALANKTKK